MPWRGARCIAGLGPIGRQRPRDTHRHGLARPGLAGRSQIGTAGGVEQVIVIAAAISKTLMIGRHNRGIEAASERFHGTARYCP